MSNEVQLAEKTKLRAEENEDDAGFERILDFIGPMGKWQIMIFVILFVLDMNLGMMNGAAVFILWKPTVECDTSALATGIKPLSVSDDACNLLVENADGSEANITCPKFSYIYSVQEKWNETFTDKYGNKSFIEKDVNTTIMTNTVVSQWDLVCSQKFQTATAQTVYLLGFLIGSLISGPASDKFGRRKVLLIATALMIVFAIGQSYLPFFWMFAICRTGYGAAFIALSLIHYVVRKFPGTETEWCSVQEITNSNWRAFMSGIFFAYSIGYAIISAFAFFIKDWRHFHIAISSPLIPCLVLMWIFVPESPRWLLANGRYEEAKKIINNAAKMNGTSLPASIDLTKMGEALAAEKAKSAQAEEGVLKTLLGVLKNPVMLLRLLDIGFCWIANNVVYYGLMLNVGDFVGNLLLNNALYGLIEAPSYVFQVVTSRFSRKIPMAFCLISCGVCLFIIPYMPKGFWQVFLCMVGKFMITASYGFVYLYTGELFPTNVRCGALGVCSIIARFGAMVAPYIAKIAEWDKNLFMVPFWIYGIVSVASGATVLVLPETAGKPMPETLDDALGMRTRLGRLRLL